jgi:excinuclease UvrABC helicase subunit UvrB
MRDWAKRSLLERDDVNLVASVSCFFGMGRRQNREECPS